MGNRLIRLVNVDFRGISISELSSFSLHSSFASLDGVPDFVFFTLPVVSLKVWSF